MDVIILSSPMRNLYVTAVLLKTIACLPMDNILVALEAIAEYSLKCYPDTFLS